MGNQVGVGCEDGSIRILDAELGLVTTLPTAGTVLLSLAYHPDGLLFVGCADGTIRRYDRTSSGGGSSGGAPCEPEEASDEDQEEPAEDVDTEDGPFEPVVTIGPNGEVIYPW